MHVLTLQAIKGLIDPSQVVQIAVLQWVKAFIKVFAKYTDYANIFSFHLAMGLSKDTDINKNTIELVEGKQQMYGLIYTLSLVKLEILKTYIEIHLKTGFIWSSRSHVGDLIFFHKKLNSNFRLCINY